MKKKRGAKKVTVAIKDLDKVCHKCGKVKDSTRRRTFFSKLYEGPCGDSFCFASCDMETCRETTKVLCDGCFKLSVRT